MASGSLMRTHWEARTMTKHERRRFFERLMQLRDAYQAERHEATTTTLLDAMATADAAMRSMVMVAPMTRPTAATGSPEPA
jgi:hypothetical protein